jgi:hypothetical protein
MRPTVIVNAKLGNQYAMWPTPIVVALPSFMTMTKLKIYAKPKNKHAMTLPDCKPRSNHTRRESEEHSIKNSFSFY